MDIAKGQAGKVEWMLRRVLRARDDLVIVVARSRRFGLKLLRRLNEIDPTLRREGDKLIRGDGRIIWMRYDPRDEERGESCVRRPRPSRLSLRKDRWDLAREFVDPYLYDPFFLEVEP
jgi:hypothetical protein